MTRPFVEVSPSASQSVSESVSFVRSENRRRPNCQDVDATFAALGRSRIVIVF